MPERQSDKDSLRVGPGQPLIGVVVREGGQQVTRFFTGTDRGADRPSGRARKGMRSFAGIWSDLDWEETEQALDRIRHESKPTPPIDEV